MDGVIGFNRFGFVLNDTAETSNAPKLNIMQDLFDDYLIESSIVQFDFNFVWEPTKPKDDPFADDVRAVMHSSMTLNGINEDNMAHADLPGHGIVYFENELQTSKWVINVADAVIKMPGSDDTKSFYRTYKKDRGGIEARKAAGVIATAYDKVKMPRRDFQLLGQHLQSYEDKIQVDTESMYAKDVDCEDLQLPMVAFSLADGSINAEIPPLYYSRKHGDGCIMLFEVNNEDNDIADPIRTLVDGNDYETNTGYIFGQPFLHAFMLMLDFEGNKVGLAVKKNNFGAVLTGPAAPGSDHYVPVKPDQDHNKPSDRPV